MNQPPLPFWGISATEMLQELNTAKDGLTADDAKQRLARYGSNLLTPPKRSHLFTLLLAQFKTPITLILLSLCDGIVLWPTRSCWVLAPRTTHVRPR